MGFAKPQRDEDRKYFKPRDHVGTLATFKVNDEDADYINPNFNDDDGRPTVWADVTILEGDDAGVVYSNATIGGKYLHEALAWASGTKEVVLGRIDKGKKAFFINDPTEEDEEFAEDFFATAEGNTATAASAAALDDEPPF